MEPTEEVGTSNSVAWESLKRDHRIYAYLARCLMSPLTMKDCIETSIRASSTDNDPEENIENTLDPRERVDARPSYWSSTGKGDPEVPETLTYKLRSQLCVINEINIRPFEGILILPYELHMFCILSVVIFVTDFFFSKLSNLSVWPSHIFIKSCEIQDGPSQGAFGLDKQQRVCIRLH